MAIPRMPLGNNSENSTHITGPMTQQNRRQNPVD
jgi:hypothetical protein